MVKMEFFSGSPPCSSCVAILDLADECAEKYRGRVEIVKYIGQEGMAKFQENKLGCVPAIVINERIRIEGICPSWQTLENALKEGGL
jgi:hypothetical protein